jgi:hypothetical protein
MGIKYKKVDVVSGIDKTRRRTIQIKSRLNKKEMYAWAMYTDFKVDLRTRTPPIGIFITIYPNFRKTGLILEANAKRQRNKSWRKTKPYKFSEFKKALKEMERIAKSININTWEELKPKRKTKKRK